MGDLFKYQKDIYRHIQNLLFLIQFEAHNPSPPHFELRKMLTMSSPQIIKKRKTFLIFP